MKKATVFFTERNKRLGENRSRSMTVDVPDDMFSGWDWSGIETIFRSKVAPRVHSDSTIRVTRIKLGNAVLQG